MDFPPGSLVLITGLPGAGKTTLLDRLYGLRGDESEPVEAEGVLVIDSRQARVSLAGLLPRLPRKGRTLAVHLTHVSRIARAVMAGRSVVAHSRASWPHLLYGFAWLARASGGRLYLIMLDVEPETAAAGQIARGRVVADATFARHVRRWQELIAQARGGSLPPAYGVVVLDRRQADALEKIDFRHVTSEDAVPS
ncbi:AAA family ATPase [Nonomuraea sp. NPDC050556]|uniref:AAA family ATPase n=1 Tax=Nonomuraea sp. NPDC050556 TaxID=3364369 RepID=UPI00378EA8FD